MRTLLEPVSLSHTVHGLAKVALSAQNIGMLRTTIAQKKQKAANFILPLKSW
jgi:hypothetical protein